MRVHGLNPPGGAYGLRVDDPDALEDALRAGLEAVNEGKAAVLDVVLG